ncbi:MAG: DUF2058 domain-containing protein [Candidatus Endonucleobacter sp. (ex Gigantidas childressi)]|nr:DUF2058 domain-containing protein [Candidatus Endonucleobacter sp. (ex Gigantidas childressi)]
MSKSLRDQLTKSGLATKQQALKAKTSVKKKKKEAMTQGVSTEQELRREQLKAEKAEQTEKDRLLNSEREEKRNSNAIMAQVIQLIERNSITRKKGDVSYHFVYEGKVKKLYVTETIQSQLSNGLLAIAVQKEEFILIPAPIAEKISERMPNIIVLQNQNEQVEKDDDWYADYQIPDDLMW